jgi:hypothetical protein
MLLSGECCKTPPEGYYGFIYEIIDDKGHIYIGRKTFEHSRKVKLSKKQRKITGKRVSVVKKSSGWLDYWGSCKPLLEYIEQRGGTKGFKRNILKLCKDKISTSYWELAYQVQYNVLFRDDCWNSTVAGKFWKNKVHK